MENIVETLTTEMMEHICDNLCKYPCDKSLTQEALEEICCECKMGHYVCSICDEYKKIRDFKNSQIAVLLKKMSETKKELEAYRAIGTVEECREAVENVRYDCDNCEHEMVHTECHSCIVGKKPSNWKARVE